MKLTYEILESREILAADFEPVLDINQFTGNPYLTEMLQVGSLIYLPAYTASLGYELWKSDGTAAGTELINDIRQVVRRLNPVVSLTSMVLCSLSRQTILPDASSGKQTEHLLELCLSKTSIQELARRKSAASLTTMASYISQQMMG